MKTENFGNQEIEKLLKAKMNELSDSVDCFDRISERAFPVEKQDFYESGLTVSGLENITGKYRRSGIIKWTAIAAAAVVCIAVVPSTGLGRRIFTNMGGSLKQDYQKLITEISNEAASGDYYIVDYKLEDYIANDLMITPLFSCPFEDCRKENANVRLFIREINDIPTNQVYAELYCGSYSEENILAAAESKYKFTFEEIEELSSREQLSFDAPNDYMLADQQYFGVSDDFYLLDSDGNKVMAADFFYSAFIKTDSGIETVSAQFTYGANADSSDSGYFYDFRCVDKNGSPIFTDRSEMWKRSVYFNGNSAMPEDDCSDFIRVNIFNRGEPDHESASELAYGYFFEGIEDYDRLSVYVYDFSYGYRYFNEMPVPRDSRLFSALSVILPRERGAISYSIMNPSGDTVIAGGNIKLDEDNYYIGKQIADDEQELLDEMKQHEKSLRQELDALKAQREMLITNIDDAENMANIGDEADEESVIRMQTELEALSSRIEYLVTQLEETD